MPFKWIGTKATGKRCELLKIQHYASLNQSDYLKEEKA